MSLGERAGDNTGSLSADEAIRRIVALLQSAGDELDRQVRGELWSAGWGRGNLGQALYCCKIQQHHQFPWCRETLSKIKEMASFNSPTGCDRGCLSVLPQLQS